MAMTRLTIRVPGFMKDAADEKAEKMGYTGTAEYVRQLIREDLEDDRLRRHRIQNNNSS